MLPLPEIESLERQSLEQSFAQSPEYRLLEAMHERVKAWPDGYEKDLELANISLLKERIGKEVFNSLNAAQATPQPSCMGGLHQGNATLAQA